MLRLAVGHGGPPELYEYEREHPQPIAGDRRSVNGRVLLTQDVVHIPDILEDEEYSWSAANEAGVRALLGAPLLVEGQLAGVFNIVRTAPEPFTDDEIELLRTFADQAAIAVANARLMEAVERQLEQQRAISDVLGAVARSEGLDSVLHAVVEAACRLCDGAIRCRPPRGGRRPPARSRPRRIAGALRVREASIRIRSQATARA